ncbi:unnamed protein product, partial [Staurois parvus]
MCNVSVSDDIITIPKPAVLVLSGPADLCQCWCRVCCLLSQRFISPPPPPLPGEFQPGICQCGSIILHSLQLSPCHCQPQIQSIRDTDFALLLVRVASYG